VIDNLADKPYNSDMLLEEAAAVKEYSVPETAELLKVSRQTVWEWVRDGLLPARRTGLTKRASYAIKAEDVQKAAERMGLELDLPKG
jgi:excisionase family DNA binding protein